MDASEMIDFDKPVRVFKNLKHGCYSIMQNGRMRATARQLLLVDVEFRVREAGRQRMLREQRRNVHAFAVGKLSAYVHPDDGRDLDTISGRYVSYNPYRFASFVDSETQDPVRFAGVAHFDESGVTYADAA